jgi:hypothetical protein
MVVVVVVVVVVAVVVVVVVMVVVVVGAFAACGVVSSVCLTLQVKEGRDLW